MDEIKIGQNDCVIKTDIAPVYEFVTSCLICGEDVLISMWHGGPKICDKCKAAIMHVRKQLEEN